MNIEKISLKICGITNSKSIQNAYKNKIQSLGFASNNLEGPNTVNDSKIKNLIKECNHYKIESVLLTKNFSLKEIIKQIGFVKPKTISCSHHFKNQELKKIKTTFKKLKIGISINPESYDRKYIKSIKDSVDIFYYDLNAYKKNKIKKYSLEKNLEQIKFIKKMSIPIYIGGGINHDNVKKIIKFIKPYGVDVSRSLKNKSNTISNAKLKKFLSEMCIA